MDAVQAARRAIATKTRQLTAGEKAELICNECTAVDWRRVEVAVTGDGGCSGDRRSFNPSAVRRCHFSGRVVLGHFSGSDSAVAKSAAYGPPTPPACPRRVAEKQKLFVEGPAAITDSHIADSWVLDGARVMRCHLIQNCVVGRGAAIVGCGVVGSPYGSSPSSFGNGAEVTVGPETGGRQVPVCAASDFEAIARFCCRHALPPAVAAVGEAAAAEAVAYGARCAAPFSVIGDGAVLRGCPRVIQCVVGSWVTVDGSVLRRSTVLGQDDLHTLVLGSTIEDSVLQPGSEVTQYSVVSGSLMCSRSAVHRNGMLLSSILAPMSSVAEGEIGSSLVGPLVGFHHQALLVAAFWPAGRGNIGYGANVGSNHTGKRNDQEIWPGEGVFYGLGCCIKYPCNMSDAPYTIIASGVTTLPQRVAMPFSLINSVSEMIPGISPALNEILPGWILSNNAYTRVRNESKFENRQVAKAGSHAPHYSHKTVRGTHVRMMLRAIEKLEVLKGRSQHKTAAGIAIYTDTDLPGGAGLGKNILTENSRVAAIQAYDTAIEYFALKTVWEASADPENRASLDKRLISGASMDNGGAAVEPYESLSGLSNEISAIAECDYAMSLIQSRQLAGCGSGLKDLTARLADMADAEATAIRRSKMKDYRRGDEIIPDYSKVQTPLEDDDVVQAISKFAALVRGSRKKTDTSQHQQSHI
mmetsp:Transcript_17482/g.51777  ORF Transcript_17482/g.51777 Transcript_17482/m.51777 type:complete len:697 (+) Transcript_17482:56-2146(+)